MIDRMARMLAQGQFHVRADECQCIIIFRERKLVQHGDEVRIPKKMILNGTWANKHIFGISVGDAHTPAPSKRAPSTLFIPVP